MIREITPRNLLLSLILCTSTFLGACSRLDDATPTLDPVMIQTQAVATFAAELTQTFVAQPTATNTMTPSPTPTETPTPTQTPTIELVILPTSSCKSLGFVSDVTIPDNSKMVPGQKFTKVWRVKNNGDCAWEEEFQVRFFSGNLMGGKTITLGKTVVPGSETDLSIELIAPSTVGVYTGNWRMIDETGAFFGDSFYVLINVVEGPTETATASPPSATPTIEITPTETPGS